VPIRVRARLLRDVKNGPRVAGELLSSGVHRWAVQARRIATLLRQLSGQ
jgi:hypothetical protein